MAKQYRLYSFEPQNPEKFKGETIPITMRSSWEVEFAKHCDLLPSVLSWSYETIQIPYRDPLTGNQKIYIPDFFVEIASKEGNSNHFVFEIKPMHEQNQENARNSKDSAMIARNNAKWAAATQWADRHSAEFAVLNEKDLYGWHEARRPRVHSVKTYSPTHATKPAIRSISRRSKALITNSAGPGAMKARLSSHRGKSPRVGKVVRTRRTPKI